MAADYFLRQAQDADGLAAELDTPAKRRAYVAARMLEPNPLPALVLYGPEDHVIPRDFPDRMGAAFPEIIGPFVVQGAGHFLMWERPSVLNRAIGAFCRDLLAQSALQ